MAQRTIPYFVVTSELLVSSEDINVDRRLWNLQVKLMDPLRGVNSGDTVITSIKGIPSKEEANQEIRALEGEYGFTIMPVHEAVTHSAQVFGNFNDLITRSQQTPLTSPSMQIA